ncbi:uncharacterized protein LY89DRAFT_489382 [Mollisia scopiformis]|uniref:Uncharacterized protein n=1 Tax=Mollisia scopiformis TaxID=149040 RepID=A0A194XGV9_MOLSC|nr:uncharacterized protein LY89DRAFT_489382 [Mollisia scopiformis]KUJ19376.1 hypothetical protein LY89DRAFT_489382 [Mollisia scopiformis]
MKLRVEALSTCSTSRKSQLLDMSFHYTPCFLRRPPRLIKRNGVFYLHIHSAVTVARGEIIHR